MLTVANLAGHDARHQPCHHLCLPETLVGRAQNRVGAQRRTAILQKDNNFFVSLTDKATLNSSQPSDGIKAKYLRYHMPLSSVACS